MSRAVPKRISPRRRNRINLLYSSFGEQLLEHEPCLRAHEFAGTPQIFPWPNHEYVRGWGVFGLPFDSGHYLALRVFPENAFAPYRTVWHRVPEKPSPYWIKVKNPRY